ncbi:MAG: TolC family protein [Alistipes sp.]|nr:TolC family protein [Candidatus Alistipes equi]
MRTNKILIISIVALICTGCGIYGNYSRDARIEQNATNLYRTETTNQADAQDVASYKEMFTDTCLLRLIDKALVQNTQLRIAHNRVQQAEAALKASKLAFLPSFAFAPNGGLSNFDWGKTGWSWNASLQATWQIDVFGGLRNAKRQRKAALEGSKAYEKAVRTEVISMTAKLYYTILMLDKQVQIAKQTTDSWKKNIETMKFMMEGGMTNDAAVSQTEADAYKVEAMMHEFESELFQAENALCSFIGTIPASIVRGNIDNQSVPKILRVGVPVELLSRRPDVILAEKTLTQSFYATQEARSAMYPKLVLQGAGGWTNIVGDVVVNPGKLLLTAAASLFQPIFQNGQLRANLKIAKKEQENASLQFAQKVLDAGCEVNNAMDKCQMSKNNALLYKKQVEALTRAVENTKLLMENGSATYIEVLYAEQALLSAKIKETANQFDTLAGMIAVYAALGGDKE